jgi:hypothetical protein
MDGLWLGILCLCKEIEGNISPKPYKQWENIHGSSAFHAGCKWNLLSVFFNFLQHRFINGKIRIYNHKNVNKGTFLSN